MSKNSEIIKSLILNLNKILSEENPENDVNYKFMLLKDLSKYFVRDEKISSDSFKYSKEVSENCYILLSMLLNSLKPTLFYEKWNEELFDNFFLNAVHHDSYMALVRHLSKCSPSYEQDKVVDLLEKFLQKGNMWSLLLYQCVGSEAWDIRCVSTCGIWDEIITLIISLPERVANKTKGNSRKIFTTSCFIPLLASSVWKVLNEIHERLTTDQDCSVEFLGKLLGRLSVAGHASTVVRKLSPLLIKACSTDFIWRKISQNLICKIPAGSLERFITPLMMHIPWYGYLEWILGDSIISNEKLGYLITTKLLLIRQFENHLILQNIIGYLASSSTRKSVFYKVFENLLKVWEDGSAIKHQSYAQQYYLTAAIMTSAGHLRIIGTESHKQDFMNRLLHGVQIRIGSPEASIRMLGMVVGENLTSAIDSTSPELKFEYEDSPDLVHLLQLLVVPEKPELNSINLDALEEEEEKPTVGGTNHDTGKGSESQNSKDSDQANILGDSLDSDDDDLEPYDMSNDVPVKSCKRPVYIRDCLGGLIENKNPEWTKECLKAAGDLIHSDDAVDEVSEEMAKVLLHLEDSYSVPDFIGLRHRALIALTVVCPVQAASYLSSQFYCRDYNIRQRLDILEVLAAASQELSQPKRKVTEVKPNYLKTDFSQSAEEHWKDIIEKRIRAKTKRISQGPSKQYEPEFNRFGPVAGYFFFPLMEKHDRGGKMLDLFGEDSYVLGRILYTLGIIMYSASNTLISHKMSASLLEFLAAIRDHHETFVRQAAIFAMGAVFISVPAFHLISDLQDSVVESQNWLQVIVEKDFDVQCQIKAAKVLAVLNNAIKNALPVLSDVIQEIG